MARIPVCTALALLLLAGLARTTPLSAQSAGEALRNGYSELAGRFDAADVTQAEMYDRLLAITESAESAAGRNALRELLIRSMTMSMAEMMAEMHQMGAMDMGPMPGPFGDLEADAAGDLRTLLQGQSSAVEARGSLSGDGALTGSAAAVLAHGRAFQARIYDIYADAGVADKQAAVDEAIDAYLSDPNSVAAEPKSPILMYGHPFAGAMKSGYPQVSGLFWASQWLQLAALEPLMSGGETAAGLNTVIERYEAKVAGMEDVSPVPTEIPMVPAISPLLLSRHPEAAWIIDNVNILEFVIADLLVHPDVEDRDGSIDAVTAEFTDKESNLLVGSMAYRDYLLSALRTGIYNQGGPALGQLVRSERNRSRMEMEMGGHVSLPGMN
ncbi:MAG: hypothetical protein OYK82_12740 [Gammaproteobacteria bacterium]|nr:hypothetical protein [Gammaproteobacteria bacterium]